MKKTKTNALALLLVCVLVAGAVVMTACNVAQDTTQSKLSYNVTYDLNYEGADSRVFPVQSGVTAPAWKPSREGYRLDYWTTDKAGTQKYDFSAKVRSDITLYAVWKQKPGIATVSFDFGYAGTSTKVIEVEKESLIQEKYKPTAERYGMELVGWYKDVELKNEWDFENDIVTENTVLHAKFEYTINIPRDEDGNIKYDNTRVFIWNSNTNCANTTVLQKIIDAFNEEHKGKIIVEQGNNLITQADTFLRIQQTPEMMKNYTTYYPVADMFTFAGLDFSNEDYFEGATNECKNKGVMLQAPVAAFSPYLVYNKTLMSKYNGNNPLPSNYSELSALLQKAAAGEASNTNFKSILTSVEWMYKEAPSYTAFAQNGADYFTYTDNVYLNTWLQDGMMAKANTAMQITYDLFGVNGLNKGGAQKYLQGNDTYQKVSQGNALFGFQTWAGGETAIANNSNLGVMPLSGMFTDSTDQYKDRVPVHGWGVGFYKYAKNVLADSLKVCAAVEFTKYLMDNAYMFAEVGFVPLSKAAANNETYVNSTNVGVQLLRECCNPQNYYTLPGSASLKPIVNVTAAEGVIVPFLTSATATRDMVEDKLKELFEQVAGQVS